MLGLVAPPTAVQLASRLDEQARHRVKSSSERSPSSDAAHASTRDPRSDSAQPASGAGQEADAVAAQQQ